MRTQLALFAALTGAAAAQRTPPRNPIVRVVAISQADLDRSRSNLFDQTLERLDRAASFRPDIAALPEVFLPGVETVPGPVTNRLAGRSSTPAMWSSGCVRRPASVPTTPPSCSTVRDGWPDGTTRCILPRTS